MDLNKTFVGQDIVLTVDASRIDAANAVYLKDAFAASSADTTGRVIMDLGAVTFMDSSGLGAMVAAMKQLTPPQKLELCNLQPAVAKVFNLTRMYTVFPIHETLGAALPNSSGVTTDVTAA